MFRLLFIALAFASPVTLACEFEGVTFSADFEAGKLDSCEVDENGTYVLSFLPEDKPINPSPWYYFSVTASGDSSSKQAKKVDVVLTFDGYTPRYLPKVSYDQKSWEITAFDTTEQGMTISLPVSKRPLYVAAQRPIPNSVYINWLKQAEQDFSIKPFTIGKSTEGRTLSAFALEKSENTEWVIFVGRQHPPEVTGAVAMFSFLNQFLTTTSETSAFLSRFNVLVVPNINPDGCLLYTSPSPRD